MHVIFATVELAPFSKVGGLGDVAKALPEALARLGAEVTVLTPWYEGLAEAHPRLGRARAVEHGQVLLGDAVLPVTYRRPAAGPGRGRRTPRLVFVEEPATLSRRAPYAFGGDPARAIQDPEGFLVFCKAVQDWVLRHPGPGRVVHLNENQTGPAAPMLKRFPGAPPVVFTGHNFAHHGTYPPTVLPLLGPLSDGFHPGSPVEFYGLVNFTKLGVVYADAITTVSPTYRAEAMERYDISLGLEGLLRQRAERFVGILNGIDSEVWSPDRSPHIAPHYGPDTLEGKRTVKAALLAEAGLPAAAAEGPVAGVVSRLVEQKGIDLILAAADHLLQAPAALVVLGAGRSDYEDALRRLERRYPDRCRVVTRYDEGLAHRITAGADLFLMPSRFEPCGLNQMYSLAFGTVPVVRATGGLADTVRDVRLFPDTGNGYAFVDASPGAFWEALTSALRAWRREPERWRNLMRRGMAEDHGWEASARDYLAVYRALLERTPLPRP